MNNIYIVIKNGCINYVSTDSLETINNIVIKVIDLDCTEEVEEELIQSDLTIADKLTRIW